MTSILRCMRIRYHFGIPKMVASSKSNRHFRWLGRNNSQISANDLAVSDTVLITSEQEKLTP
jgi:hypothetical protein